MKSNQISPETEGQITISNRALVAASRKLSSTKFTTALEYKTALQDWLMAKCAALEAYRIRELEKGDADSWTQAEIIARQIGTYNEVEERLIHTATN